MERLWYIEETNFWELWRMWGYVKEQHFPLSATLQLAVLLSLFLLVWKHGDRKRWVLFYNCTGDQRHLSVFYYFVVREGWNATLLPSYISPSGSLPKRGGRTHRAVWPSLVRLEGQGLHRQAWKVGKQKSWGGYQERSWLRRECEIRRKAESSCVCLGRHWWCRELTSLLANRQLPVDAMDLSWFFIPDINRPHTALLIWDGRGNHKTKSDKTHGLW